MAKADRVRLTVMLTTEQLQAVVDEIPKFPLSGAGQITRSTVIGHLIDKHLLKKAG